MAIDFLPDIVLPDDEAGFGFWLNGHYFEHQRFIGIIQGLSPSYDVPDFAFNVWRNDDDARNDWLSAHQTTHESLRQFTGVTGLDLSVVDFKNKVAFFEWMDAHAQEHQFLRIALGAL